LHERARDLTLRRRGGAAACALAAVIAIPVLAGCTSGAPAPTPAPSPSLTQEQQDDQAFRELVDKYDALDPNTSTDGDLTPLLTGSVLESERKSVKESRDSGETVEGLDTLSGFRVTDRGIDANHLQYMTAQVCLDVSGTRIRDAQGNDTTPDRDPRLSLQMKAVTAGDGTWRISDIVRNEGVRACG
jgi:hypothetical protein